MPVAGVVCMADGSYQDFETCIHNHENYLCNCDALPFSIKLIRDNMKGRSNAGISASTLTGCPREKALLEKYDYYEPINLGWIKGEGTLIHAMIEMDDEEGEHIMKERRVVRYLDVDGVLVRISGQMDRVDRKYRRLIDYKRKERVPWKPDPTHEFQFNVYVWLLADGTVLEDKLLGLPEEPIQLEIVGGGMHYVSRNKDQPFKKIAYPIWDVKDTEELMRQRLRPVLKWQNEGVIPDCDPYQRYGGSWECGCVLIERQARERGIWVD